MAYEVEFSVTDELCTVKSMIHGKHHSAFTPLVQEEKMLVLMTFIFKPNYSFQGNWVWVVNTTQPYTDNVLLMEEKLCSSLGVLFHFKIHPSGAGATETNACSATAQEVTEAVLL